VTEGDESEHRGDPLAAFVGDGGSIPLFSLKTRCSVGELKMSGTARNVAFAPGGRELLSSGDDGVVHVWDLRMRRCLARFVDDGCVKATSVAVSPGGRHYAAGSDVGVVNLYRAADVPRAGGAAGAPAGLPAAPGAPAPAKALMQLTTAVDTLRFSPDGQMLAMASRLERDALRVVHTETGTVFSNWPTSKTPIGYVHSAAFSPGCGFLAVGNAKGRVLLYRLHHYTSI